MTTSPNQSANERYAAAFRVVDPNASRLATEAREIVERLSPTQSRMRSIDQRYLKTLRQFVAREDLEQRMNETRLIWMRELAGEYLS